MGKKKHAHKNLSNSAESKESIPGEELDPIEDETTEVESSEGETIPGSEGETEVSPVEVNGSLPAEDVPGKYRKFQ
jgi:hypothetical protein